MVGEMRWWLPWNPWKADPWLGLGYRIPSFDHDCSAGNSANLELRGAYTSLGFAF